MRQLDAIANGLEPGCMGHTLSFLVNERILAAHRPLNEPMFPHQLRMVMSTFLMYVHKDGLHVCRWLTPSNTSVVINC